MFNPAEREVYTDPWVMEGCSPLSLRPEDIGESGDIDV